MTTLRILLSTFGALLAVAAAWTAQVGFVWLGWQPFPPGFADIGLRVTVWTALVGSLLALPVWTRLGTGPQRWPSLVAATGLYGVLALAPALPAMGVAGLMYGDSNIRWSAYIDDDRTFWRYTICAPGFLDDGVCTHEIFEERGLQLASRGVARHDREWGSARFEQHRKGLVFRSFDGEGKPLDAVRLR